MHRWGARKFTEKEKRGDQMGNHRDAPLRCKGEILQAHLLLLVLSHLRRCNTLDGATAAWTSWKRKGEEGRLGQIQQEWIQKK
jgi:hypothetical protein